MIKKAKDIV